MKDVSDISVTKKRCTRNRTGCHNCKKRKKRCDERKPCCSACKRLNLKCGYEVRLVWNANKLTSYDVPKLSYELPMRKHIHLINYTARDIELSDIFNFHMANDTSNLMEQNKDTLKKLRHYYEPLVEDKSILPHVVTESNSEIENELFNHYVEVLSKKKSFSDPQFNEFRSLIVPKSVLSPALYQSVLALSSNDIHRKDPLKKEQFASLATGYKHEAINSLYNILDSEPNFVSNQSSEKLKEIIVTILMLCSLEISDKGNIQWVSHLREASLVFSSLTEGQILQSDLLLFAYRYFALRYILLLTTFNRSDLKSFMECTPWPMIESYFQGRKTDHLLGCSPTLAYLIHQTTILRLDFEDYTVEPFIVRYEKLKNDMWNLTQIFDQNENDYLSLYICSQAYYYSAKLYFQNCFIEAERKAILSFLSFESFWKSTCQVFIQEILTRLNGLISRPDSPNLFPTWCLFITACCFPDDALKYQILDVFEDLEKIWPLASPIGIRVAIECIWSVHDLLDLPQMRYRTDWRDILSVVGFKLALT